MNSIVLGIILGVIFGAIVVVPMRPMTFSDKRAAMLGAFLNRFAIGFLIPNSGLPIDPIFKGLFISILLSLPDAVITKAYVPIMGLGIIGGLVIGLVVKLVGAS
jgi:hypothetical protein